MPKAQRPDARLPEMEERSAKRLRELWTKHENEFMQILDESESRKVNLSFRVTLDFSESKATSKMTMGFAQVVKDSRSDSFDDPNQTTSKVDAEAAAETKRLEAERRKKAGLKPDSTTKA